MHSKLDESEAITESQNRRRGHACVEYLFMMALVIFAAIAGIAVLGNTTHDLYLRAKNTIPP